MGYFALLDGDNIVRQVVRVENAAMDDLPFPQSEPVGQAMLAASGIEGHWIQCSYNANFRGAYPGIQGWSYDPVADVFVPPAAPVEPAP